MSATKPLSRREVKWLPKSEDGELDGGSSAGVRQQDHQQYLFQVRSIARPLYNAL